MLLCTSSGAGLAVPCLCVLDLPNSKPYKKTTLLLCTSLRSGSGPLVPTAPPALTSLPSLFAQKRRWFAILACCGTSSIAGQRPFERSACGTLRCAGKHVAVWHLVCRLGRVGLLMRCIECNVATPSAMLETCKPALRCSQCARLLRTKQSTAGLPALLTQ